MVSLETKRTGECVQNRNNKSYFQGVSLSQIKRKRFRCSSSSESWFDYAFFHRTNREISEAAAASCALIGCFQTKSTGTCSKTAIANYVSSMSLNQTNGINCSVNDGNITLSPLQAMLTMSRGRAAQSRTFMLQGPTVHCRQHCLQGVKGGSCHHLQRSVTCQLLFRKRYS